MHCQAILTAVLFAAPLAAQNWHIPDGSASTSVSCNAIPFGSTPGGGGYQSKYQTKATVADLGALPGLITGLGFAPCGNGWSHFDSIEIVFDHHPAGAPLSATFAANLTANAVTVLAAVDHTWHVTGNTWNEIGLQRSFAWNGIDDLVIQVTSVNGTSPVGFHRGTRQRIAWVNSTGTAPAAGTSSLTALKFEVGMVMARVSSYGIACVGSNGLPSHTVSGTPQLSTTTGFDLANGVANSFGILMHGFHNGAPPWPLELTGAGMPGCYMHHDIIAQRFVFFDGAGAGSVAITIPNDAGLLAVKLYSQYACVDPAANTTGLTMSNYNRILIGN